MVCIVAKLAVNFKLMVFEVPLSQVIGYLLCIYFAWGGWERREVFSCRVQLPIIITELTQNKNWEGVKNCLSSCSHNGEDAGSWTLMFSFANKV